MEERRAVLLENVTALPKVKQTRLRCSWGRALACKCEVLSLIPTHVKMGPRKKWEEGKGW